jgi:4-amino-4-deoxy-L-arabinose transferase-like glycosyltransferase
VPVAVLGAVVATAGVALRVYVYDSRLGAPNSDEAVVGLMALHILHGQFTTFYWGQGYGGSQEAFVTAPVFFVFGGNWLALRVVPIALMAVAALVVWRIGRRLFGEPAGIAAGALLWLWPPYALDWTTHQFGFYASGILYAALLLLLALRAASRPTPGRVAVFGFIVGLALWDDTQLVPVVAPIVAWVIWRRPAVLRHAWLAVPAAIVGALPWLVWNAHHGFASFQTHIAARSSYQHRLRIFFSPLLPMLLGLRTPFSQQALVSGAAVDVALLLLTAAFAYGAWRTRRTDASILYFVTAAFPFLYAISRATLFSSEPRYLLVLVPAVVLLLVQAASTWPRAATLVIAVAALSAVTLGRMDRWVRSATPVPPIAPHRTSSVIAALRQANVDRVIAHYWASYLIDFDTRERIIATENKLTSIHFIHGRPVLPADPFDRWPPYRHSVSQATRVAFVFVDWPSDANRAKRSHVLRELVAHGYHTRRFDELVLALPPAR